MPNPRLVRCAAVALALACGASAAAAQPALPYVDDFTTTRPSPVAPEPLGTALTPVFLADDPAPAPDPDQVGSGRMERRKPKDPKAPKEPKDAKDAPAETPKLVRPSRRPGMSEALGGARARILLQSLTVPGWGQATLGRRTSASVFAIAEAGIWSSFTAFRVQQVLRRRSYEETAELFAGIDLDHRDEEFRRIVGSFPSSEDYNLFVVTRDAANIFMKPGHEDIPGYRAYIEEHALRGADAWAWDSRESYERYQNQRKQTQRAGQRANTVLALAIGNRLLSAIHAARYANVKSTPRSWNLECVPAGGDPTAFHLGVRARF